MRHNCRNIFCLLVLLFITAPGCVSPNEPFLEIQDIKRTLLLENGEQTTISTEWFEIKDKLPASPNGRNYQFKRITTEDGLSQNIVRTVIQDRFGYMWIGTDGGLNRFDGDGFILYENDADDPTSLSSNQVWAILETRDGSMWIGTDDGLNRLNPGSRDFTRFFHDYTPSYIGLNRRQNPAPGDP